MLLQNPRSQSLDGFKSGSFVNPSQGWAWDAVGQSSLVESLSGVVA